MNTGNVAEVTYLQSDTTFIVWQIARRKYRVHVFYKVWLKLNEHCGSGNLLKFLISENLQSAPNDPKLNDAEVTKKYQVKKKLTVRYSLLSTMMSIKFG